MCLCAIRVCVLCNPCVCLCAIRVCVCGRFFIVNYVVFWACLKKCKGGHFRRVFTFKMTCEIRVCVLGGHSARILWGKRKLDPVEATGNHRFGEIRVCA